MYAHSGQVIGDPVKQHTQPEPNQCLPSLVGTTDLCKHEIMATTCVLCSPKWQGYEWDVARTSTHCIKCGKSIASGTRVHRKWHTRYWQGMCCED